MRTFHPVVRFILDYSLELFCALILFLTLIRILFFPELPLVRSLVNGFAIVAVFHEFEEKRVPGGFYDLTQNLLGVQKEKTDTGLSAAFVMLYWIVILGLSFIFDQAIWFFIMLIALGIFEMVAHTAIVFIGRLGKFYSPGMISAWLMGAMSIYSIFMIHEAGLATWYDYIVGSALMLMGFALMQRASASASQMTYGTLLRNMRDLLFKHR